MKVPGAQGVQLFPLTTALPRSQPNAVVVVVVVVVVVAMAMQFSD